MGINKERLVNVISMASRAHLIWVEPHDILVFGHGQNDLRFKVTFQFHSRDLSRNLPACLLGGLFPENLFGRAEISMKNIKIVLFWTNKQTFSFLTQ